MRLLAWLKALHRYEYPIGKIALINVLGLVLLLGVVFIMVSTSEIDGASEVKIELELLEIKAFKNETGNTTGYRLILRDPDNGKQINYPVIGHIRPTPIQGDRLPFSRLDAGEGQHQYVFDKAAWRAARLGI